MSTIFFPGCKVLGSYPRESKLLKQYLESRMDLETTQCCRKNYQLPTEADCAVFVCNNCSQILGESSNAGSLISVWEIIDKDEKFPFPDYHGKEIALQDCWLASNRPDIHEHIRSLCKKMNIAIVETANNKSQTVFCGTNRFVEPSKNNVALAPNRWGKNMNGGLRLVSKENWEEEMRKECESLPGEQVICYCKFCADGLRLGSKKPLHLLELLFPEE